MAKGHKCDGRTVKGNRGIGSGSKSAQTSGKKSAKGASGYKMVKHH